MCWGNLCNEEFVIFAGVTCNCDSTRTYVRKKHGNAINRHVFNSSIIFRDRIIWLSIADQFWNTPYMYFFDIV